MATFNCSRMRSRKPAKEEIYRFVAKNSSEMNGKLGKSDQPLNLCLRDICHSSRTDLESRLTTPSLADVSLMPSPRRRKKRSAIFVPQEKLSNEVCICKFKFVAGHEPRLQEKKVLSIDSGGNFRFFPEIQAKQSQQLIHPREESPPSAASPLKPIPELIPIESILPSLAPNNLKKTEPVYQSPSHSTENKELGRHFKQRPSRKLSRRQKLEQTFRDKGFLIQTQHVQATQGSVFCKFRQLKKFTRYLYRSWRNYLPEDRGIQE